MRGLLQAFALKIAARHRAVDHSGGYSKLLEVIDLVLHQRNQRRNDEGQSGESQGGKLKAQRLAAAGGHDGDNVLSTKNEIDNFALCGPEIVKSKPIPEKRARVHGLECKDTCGQPRTDGTTLPFVLDCL